MKKIEFNYFYLIIFIIFSLTLRLFFIDKNPYWMDESYTSWFTNQSYYNLIFWVPTFESHPPFYYLVTKLWNHSIGLFFNLPERYFSLLTSIFLFYTSYQISRVLCFDDRQFFLKLSIFMFIGLSPVIAWYSLEARPYLLLMLSYSIAIYGFFSIILNKDKSSYRAWIILSLGTLITNWSHSTGPIYSFVIYVALLNNYYFNRNGIHIKFLVGSVIAVFIFSLPLLYIIIQQLQGWSSSTWIPEPDINYILNVLKFLYFPHSHSGYGYIEVIFKALMTGLSIYGLYKITKDKNYQYFYLIFFAISIPVINLIISKIGPNIFLDRTLSPVIIPYYIFLSISITSIVNRRIRYGLFIIIFLFLSGATYDTLKYQQKEPWDQVYNHLLHQKEENYIVLLLPNSIELAVAHVNSDYKQTLNIHAIPHAYPAIGLSTFYPGGTPSVPGFTSADVDDLRKLLNHSYDKVLLVTRVESLFDPEGLIHDSLISENLSLTSSKHFRGITVYEYQNTSKGLGNEH
ncbi:MULTISPECIES: hypothetical protein [unclassified Methylophaga]|nr:MULTISPECIES: hypothetical protein [unclassified Methylophaga]